MNHSAKVSFITVNFNQPQVTLELYKSLCKLTYDNWELVIVDNGSEKTVAAEFIVDEEKVKYLRLNENLGFAGGNNEGIRIANGDFLFFVNNDTEVSPDIVQPLLKVFDDNAQVGMISPKILYYKSDRLIQYAGSTRINPYTLRNKTIGNKEYDRGQYSGVRETAYIHGAAMIIPRTVMQEVGVMYTDYFLYYEELDWSERVRRAGYELWYCGQSEIYHKESLSTGVDSPLKIYYLNRNRLVFARRNFPNHQKVIAMLFFTLVAFPKNLFLFLVQGRFDLAKALFSAMRWNFTNKVKNIR